ncbi:Hsp20/alpha crystallin family protein [Streptomyces tropicalis]|uniref:Hsp20/alpha crystallin family protein n=1 Tax=Streptomyces tropicalis TaxID=3034234 RepID=A0ABT6A3E4_9ACTN|nr:Hsp20/alpha crystallin family protein [Streptomyces tropicalis]MDF3299157.1 Hsp20/alpha crystallin family protein [Streptomyces tropicalis]
MPETPTRRHRPLPDIFDWFDDSWIPSWLSGKVGSGTHAIRIEELDQSGEHLVRAELPGMDPEQDIEVSVADGVLTIRAEHSEQIEEKQRSEFRYGSFARSLALPRGTADKDIHAAYEDGILTVRFPMPAEDAAEEHSIPIRHKE